MTPTFESLFWGFVSGDGLVVGAAYFHHNRGSADWSVDYVTVVKVAGIFLGLLALAFLPLHLLFVALRREGSRIVRPEYEEVGAVGPEDPAQVLRVTGDPVYPGPGHHRQEHGPAGEEAQGEDAGPSPCRRFLAEEPVRVNATGPRQRPGPASTPTHTMKIASLITAERIACQQDIPSKKRAREKQAGAQRARDRAATVLPREAARWGHPSFSAWLR